MTSVSAPATRTAGFFAARIAFVLTLASGFWLVFDCPLSFWLT